jgi:hypothetical protein
MQNVPMDRACRITCVLILVLGALAIRPDAAPARSTQAAEDLVIRLAIDIAPDGDLEPISLEGPTGPLYSVYDRFRLAAVAARHAWRSGKPLDPARPPKALLEPRTLILGFARTPRGDELTPPRSIEIVRRTGRAERLARLDADRLAALLPGVDIPAQTLAVLFDVPALQPTDRVHVVFNSTGEALQSRGVASVPGQLAGPVALTAPKPIATPPAAAPPGVVVPAAGAVVRVEGVLDLAGRVRYARAIDGPAELRPHAVAAVERWRYEPARMFTAPIPLVMRVDVAFGR